MADLKEDEFLKRIGVASQPLVTPSVSKAQIDAQETGESVPGFESIGAGGGGISLLPMSDEALSQVQASTASAQSGRPQRVPQSKWADPDFATKLGARPGVPFDSTTGVPWLTRLRMSAQPSKEEEVKALKAAYPDGNVRLNSYGSPVVTVKDESGKEKDVMANPLGLDIGDSAALVGQFPEIAGGVLAAIATRGGSVVPGVLNAIKTLGAMALGTEGAGAVKDLAVRSMEGEPTQPGEIAARRAGMAGVDMGVGAGLGFFSKAATTAISPFSKPGPINFNAREAQKYFEGKYGVSLPLTPAESTGNGFLQRSEAMWMAKPGSSTAFDKFVADRNAQIKELQAMATGGAVPDEELAGQRALAAIGAKVSPTEFAVEREAAATANSAEGEIKSAIGPSVNKATLGQGLRNRAVTLKKEFQDQSNKLYDEVFSDPLTQTKNIPGGPLAKDAEKLMAKLPTIEQRTSKLGYDAYGNPIEVTGSKDEVLKEFVPDKLLPKLRALQQGEGQDFRLDELMAMRREVDNDIALGESIPGAQTRYLSQVRGMLTDTIKKGLDKLSPDLLAKWETANAEYAKGVTKFKRAGIPELFRDPEQPSFIGDSQLVSRATEGKSAADHYQAYKEFFGSSSPEVQGLHQAIRDDVLSLSELSSTIDAKGLVRRLEALDKDAPEALKDAFGSSAKELRQSAMALRASGGENLPKDELVELAKSGNLSAKKLADLQSAQATRDQVYRNELLKTVADGSVKADRIRPTEVVDKLVFRPSTQPADLEKLVSMLGSRPDVLEDMRRLTMKRVLDDATIKGPTGERILGAKELESALGDENLSKRLTSVLGSGGVEDLKQLSAFLQPGSIQQQSAKSAGGISAGQQISAIMDRGELKYIGRAVKNFVMAQFYTSPAMRNYFSNNLISEKGSANVVNYAIASTPFVEALTKTFTKEGARVAMADIKGSIDRYVHENPQSAQHGQAPTNGAGEIPWDQFLKRIGAPPETK